MINLLGLDIGTTGCKAILFDSDGNLLAGVYREYNVDFPYPQWAEQNLENVWLLVQEAICEVVLTAGINEIAAIGLSVHGEAVTAVDKNGISLRPTILGMDTRTSLQNDWVKEYFGSESIFQRTGMPIHTINTLPKLLWIKQNEPEIWKNADKFLLVEDYFIKKMTGEAVLSECLASRTQMFNLELGQWNEEIIQAFDLTTDRLGRVQPSGISAGRLQSHLIDAWGLKNTPQIVTGGHDQACGALGVGLTRPGLACVSTGTAEVVEVVLPKPVLSKTLFEGNISIYRHVIPDQYLAMTLNHCGGISLRWFRDNFCELQVNQAQLMNIDPYDLILEGNQNGPTGLLVLPHFAGSGTPTFDIASKAVILGLTFATSRKDIAKAILEGVTYELRVNLDLLKSSGIQIDTLRAIGGGAKSPFWLQLKADISGIPVVKPVITEAASFGAALLAGVGAGVYPSVVEAANRFLNLETPINPRTEFQDAYQQSYELYCKVYPAVAPIVHQL